VSEDLRDGLHGVRNFPKVKAMLKYVAALNQLGVKVMTIGIYPGVKNRVDTTIRTLLHDMKQQFPDVIPIVLCLATKESLAWTGECKKINPNLQAIVFMGTAPSRLLVEEWNPNYVLKQLGWAVKEATKRYRIDVIGATEHTTQTPPDFLREIIKTQVKNGAKYFCIADTIGVARPVGTYRIVRFVKKVLDETGAKHIKLDWHGHRDIGNDVSNTMTALAAGVDRVHTVARGVGERAGNTQMEAILLNCTAILKEAGMEVPWKMKELSKVLSMYGKLVKESTPVHGPLAERSYKTSLGIHTAAMLKAEKLAHQAQSLGDEELANKLNMMARNIYSAVDPHQVGKKPEISVGPFSGVSTVKLAYLARGGKPGQLSPTTTKHVLTTAKKLGRELSTEELDNLLNNKH
jgi:2-isopropylmalate synthase